MNKKLCIFSINTFFGKGEFRSAQHGGGRRFIQELNGKRPRLSWKNRMRGYSLVKGEGSEIKIYWENPDYLNRLINWWGNRKQALRTLAGDILQLVGLWELVERFVLPLFQRSGNAVSRTTRS